MKNKFEVYEWNTHKYKNEIKTFEFHLVYSGESFIKTIFTMIKLKRSGAGCIKLKWRPLLTVGVNCHQTLKIREINYDKKWCATTKPERN